MSLLLVEGVTVQFGGLVALAHVDIEIAPGEVRGIIGPNGSGKTTLFNAITGVQRPNAGRLSFDGRDITKWPSHKRAHAGIGRSFQTVGLAPGLTARENVLATVEALARVKTPYPRRSRAVARRAQADELLAFFEIERYADQSVSELPLGITKMLEIAKVFAGEPRLVLLDEPFAGLNDREGADRVAMVLRRRELTGAAVVIVEHDVPLLVEACDGLTVLDQGKVVATGEPTAVITDRDVLVAYLGEVVTR